MTNNYLKTSLLALATMVACTEIDKIDESHNSVDNGLLQELSITGKDFQFEDVTRSTVTIGESGASFTWDEDDVIGIFPDKGDQVSFVMDEGAGTQTATFSGGGWALKSSAKYAAYYPHVYENRDMTAIPVSYVGQTQNGNGNTDHIGAYDFMAAGVSTPENGAVAFDMQHLGALVQLTITVPEPSTLTKVVLTSSTKFTETGTIDLTAETPAITADTQSNTLEIVLNNVSTTVENENVVVYFMTAPVDLTESMLTAIVYFADESNSEVELTGKKMQAGKAYRFTVKDSTAADPDDYIDEYGINHGKGVEIDGIIWAPVNCGYHQLYFKWGKLYQWGRKYGQGYSGVLYEEGGIIGEVSDAYGAELGRETPTLEVGQSESNAHVFYLSSSSTLYDWLNRHNSTYWNSGSESSPIKTEYDPCPAGWRVPTYDELDILSQNTSFWITTDDNQTACIFSGTTPYTNEPVQLIMTAAGYRSGSECTQRGNRGEYWSSRAYGGGNTATVAYSFGLLNGYEPDLIGSDRYRSRGHSVRCVRDQVEEDAPGDDEVPVPISSVNLNQTSLSIYEGDYSILVATVGPEDATDKNVFWSSSDPSVATVVQTGFTTAVTAVSPGSVVISATVGGMRATCVVSVQTSPDYIDEYGINHGKGIRIGQLVWAPVNCGYHENDYKYGKLYQWGRKDGQGYEGDADVPELHDGRVSVEEGQDELNANVFFMSGSTNYFTWMLSFDETLWNSGTEESPIKTEYDPCPEGWRVPTNRELKTNYTNKSTWTTNEDGQNGYWFSGPNTYGEKVSRVFLSAAGYRNGKGQSLARGREGHYMSSYVSGNRHDLLNLSTSNVINGASLTSPIYGLSVRCIRE